jgi:hypothetical protein
MTDTVQHGVRLTGDKIRLREFRISSGSRILTMLTPSSVMTG